MKHILALLLVLLTTSFKAAAQEPEISLFDSDGSPVAYINMEDEMTIYSWSGKPVAYLESSSGGGFNIYESMGNILDGLRVASCVTTTVRVLVAPATWSNPSWSR